MMLVADAGVDGLRRKVLARSRSDGREPQLDGARRLRMRVDWDGF
jgi:hypothetical protein